MDSDIINEILTDMIYAVMAPGLSRAAVKKTASKLQTFGIEESFEPSNGIDDAKSALEICGAVLADVSGEMIDTADIVCGVIYSGFYKMNPCYIIIFSYNRKISVKAYAKEGLIKQHTAEKAMDMFKAALFN